MIIYGSRMYGRRDVVKGWGSCESCGIYSLQSSYNGRKWGHLYFVPLFPLSSKVRVLKECSHCSHGMHIPEKDVADMIGNLRKRSDAALAALISGQQEFDSDGTVLSCAACLSDSVDFFHCLLADDYVRLVLAALQEKNLDYVYHLVNGESQQFHGKLDDAEASYRKAVACEPQDVLPLSCLGSIHLKKNDYDGARLIYEKTLELAQDKLPVHQVLLTVYNALDCHAELTKSYEACFSLLPELAQDKKFVKAYKKACKKAGKAPGVEKQNV